jgi:hypothetical protein
MTRAEAIEMLNEPLYNEIELENDIVYFCNKLDITRAELDNSIKMPLKKYSDYDNWDSKLKYVDFLRKLYELLR